MKFKHALNVFVDNFNTTYKVLLYRATVLILSLCMYTAVILPFIGRISDTTQVNALSDALASFGSAFVNLDFAAIQSSWAAIREAFMQLMELLGAMVGSVVLTVVIIVLVYLVQRFLLGLGNYTVGALINDKMAMRADSPFIGTLIKNLGKAALYNAIYVPLSFLYDAAIFAASGAAVYGLISANTPLLLLVFLFSTLIAFLYVLKMTFTSDWLPALIYGKMTNRGAMAYSFGYGAKGKKIADVMSNYVVLILIIYAVNVAAALLTLGAGLLISLPASYVILISFEFVNYCDNNEIKYFMNKNTVVKPDREQAMTRESFFKGENNE